MPEIDSATKTRLLTALVNNDIDDIEQLVIEEYPIESFIIDAHGATILSYAVGDDEVAAEDRDAHFEMIQYILDIGCNPSAVVSTTGSMAIHTALRNPNIDLRIITLLAERAPSTIDDYALGTARLPSLGSGDEVITQSNLLLNALIQGVRNAIETGDSSPSLPETITMLEHSIRSTQTEREAYFRGITEAVDEWEDATRDREEASADLRQTREELKASQDRMRELDESMARRATEMLEHDRKIAEYEQQAKEHERVEKASTARAEELDGEIKAYDKEKQIEADRKVAMRLQWEAEAAERKALFDIMEREVPVKGEPLSDLERVFGTNDVAEASRAYFSDAKVKAAQKIIDKIVYKVEIGSYDNPVLNDVELLTATRELGGGALVSNLIDFGSKLAKDDEFTILLKTAAQILDKTQFARLLELSEDGTMRENLLELSRDQEDFVQLLLAANEQGIDTVLAIPQTQEVAAPFSWINLVDMVAIYSLIVEIAAESGSRFMGFYRPHFDPSDPNGGNGGGGGGVSLLVGGDSADNHGQALAFAGEAKVNMTAHHHNHDTDNSY